MMFYSYIYILFNCSNITQTKRGHLSFRDDRKKERKVYHSQVYYWS